MKCEKGFTEWHMLYDKSSPAVMVGPFRNQFQLGPFYFPMCEKGFTVWHMCQLGPYNFPMKCDKRLTEWYMLYDKCCKIFLKIPLEVC